MKIILYLVVRNVSKFKGKNIYDGLQLIGSTIRNCLYLASPLPELLVTGATSMHDDVFVDFPLLLVVALGAPACRLYRQAYLSVRHRKLEGVGGACDVDGVAPDADCDCDG